MYAAPQKRCKDQPKTARVSNPSRFAMCMLAAFAPPLVRQGRARSSLEVLRRVVDGMYLRGSSNPDSHPLYLLPQPPGP